MDRPNKSLLIPTIGIMVLAMVTGCATPGPPPSHIPPQQGNLPAISQGKQNLSKSRNTVVTHAVESIGTAYSWGGTSPAAGFDCSGLVTFAHSRAGIVTPRTARDQFIQGRSVNFPDLLPGDLIFFRSPKKSGYHVGIYTGRYQFVHAPGKGRKVVLASLNNAYFKRHYIGARSYL